MPTSAQPLRELSAAKNGPQTFGSLCKKQMVSVGRSHNFCTTIGISRPSKRIMPMDVARFATVGKVDA
jgi:hypothetical protein